MQSATQEEDKAIHREQRDAPTEIGHNRPKATGYKPAIGAMVAHPGCQALPRPRPHASQGHTDSAGARTQQACPVWAWPRPSRMAGTVRKFASSVNTGARPAKTMAPPLSNLMLRRLTTQRHHVRAYTG